jgi:hypothetical protein
MRLTISKLAGAIAPLPILLACASGGAISRDLNVITAPELAHGGAGSTYDAIRHIRPEMLRSRDPGSLMLFKTLNPAVAVDNKVFGGVEALRAIPADQVARLEYVSASKAANRYGRTFKDGIVLVQTRDSSGSQLSLSR